MSIVLTAIQAATDAAIAQNRLSFANLQEFNSFTDSFQFADYPRNIVVPFDLSGTFLNNRIKKNVLIQGWILTRIAQDTNDWRSVSLETQYIDPMREIALSFINQFLHNEDVSDIIKTDPEVEPVAFTIRPEYMFLKDHLFGVSYSVTIPTIGRKC